ncbi:MAG: DNA double-strand break repair nuclease NurA [archaeon]|nr:DNA double-strand break repair nuclease NurA [archaeon]
MGFSAFIDRAVSFIHFSEDSKKKLAEKLVPLREKKLVVSGEILEDSLVLPVHEKAVAGRIGGVDSGFVGKRLSSLDVLLVRAVGVVFDFEDGAVKKCSYVPTAYSFPVPFITKAGLEADEANASNSLLRLKEEIKTAIAVIKEHSPSTMFLDGSIVPQYVDKPRSDSVVNNEYLSTIKLFEELFETATQNNCLLAGCVEDSRGKRFVDIIETGVIAGNGLGFSLEHIFDASLLDYFLEQGQRTFCFPYTKDASRHPILKDFDSKWSSSIFSFYVKPAVFDRPLRVEFLSSPARASATASEIASTVFSLSSHHREYAYPSVLIEADLRARLTPQEIDTVYNKIVDKVSRTIKLRLRRDKRPF